ncbi:TPA: CPBP family intramembrane metalloprotease [Streptococcus agalactiae]|nr:CPBP family intramembrane metalloprotease [Streptococcus agalactiae]
MKQIKHQSLLMVIGLIMIAVIFYSLGLSLVFLGSENNLQENFQRSLMIFMPIGFIILPSLIIKNQLTKESEISFNWKQYLMFSIAIYIFNSLFIKSDEYFQQLVVSASEEVLFRYILYRLLREDYSKLIVVLITSLLFGFILHMNYPVIDNLLIRTPLGLLFSILAMKFGLQYSIATHWLYNLVVSRI